MRLALVLVLAACQNRSEADTRRDPRCVQVDYGYGRTSEIPLAADVVASGLEAPSGLAFLPDGTMVVAERPGIVVRIDRGRKRELARVHGVLDLALHPDFAHNHWLYLAGEHRVERWRVSGDYRTARRDRVIVDGIEAGRIAFGPDRKLYVATGDAGKPKLAQDTKSLAGKILRLADDGSIPRDNPRDGSAIYMFGTRDVGALAWRGDGTLAIGHRSRHDELTLATAGANLGWPTTYGCDSRAGTVAPALTWSEAVPTGGAVFYDGGSISDWRGDLVVATLKSHHLHHVRFDRDGDVVAHDVALVDRGRLRSAIIGPDHELYVTTSNCDGHGECPPERDVILRVTRAR